MKKLLVLSMLIGVSVSYGQQITLSDQSSEHVVISHRLLSKPFVYRSLNSNEYVDFSGTYEILSDEKGAPALPHFNTSVQLPATGNPVLVIEYDGITEVQNVSVLPSKGNLKRNVDPASVPFTFGEAYQQNAFYPASPVSLTDPFLWRKTRGITLSISPYQYNPVTKTLRIHENLRVRVEYRKDVPGLAETTVSEADPLIRDQQQKQFINYSAPKYSAIGEEGDLLIITSPAFESSLEELVKWKKARGLSTELVTTATAGSTDTDIKAYIQNYYLSHPGLLYVLLVGDHEQLPSHTYGMTSDDEEIWSDSYYGQLAGGATDFHPEVFVGRFPAATVADAAIMAGRTVEYERDPAAGTWMQKAIGIGSSEGDGIGDDGEIDYEHIRNIRTRLMDYGYEQVYEFYQGSQGGEDLAGNPNSLVVGDAVNAGVGLMNYTGHGDRLSFVTSSYSYTKIMNATNNGMYPFVISVACNNGTFVGNNCLAEGFLRSENNGTPAGGIGFAGSSILMSWAPPMQTQDEMTEIIAEAYAGNKKTTLGGLFYNAQLSMLEEYSGNSGREVMQTWILFGDPSVVFRNKESMTLTASHLANVPLGTTSLEVSCNTEDALVAISQNGELIGKGMVNGGEVTVSFDALVSDSPLTVIATKQNYKPYMKPVQVGNGTLGVEKATIEAILYPNPANDVVNVLSGSRIIDLKVFSVTGQQIPVNFTEIANGVSVNTSVLSAGSYFIHLSGETGQTVERIEIVR